MTCSHPTSAAQFNVFGQALTWLFGELVDQRADEPVAFLAQLGRDHRKYGVTQSHYYSMHEALYTTLRSHLIENWDDKLDDTARAALELIIGVMRGAADAEQGPPFCDGTVVEHQSGVPRPLGGPAPARPAAGLLPRPVRRPSRCRSGRAAGATSVPAIPADPGGGIEFHVRSVTGGMVSPTIVGGDPARRPVAAVEPARRHADRPRRRRRADGRGQHRPGAAAGADHGPHPVGRQPAGPPVLRRPLSVRALRPAHAVADRVEQPVAVGDAGVGVHPRSAVGRRLSRCAAAPRPARAPDRASCPRW